MTETARRRAVLVGLLVVAGCVFLLGIHWGLPSRAVDPYLFGDEPAWSGEKIAKLAPSDASTLGADVDVNPLAKTSLPIVLNDTDEKRAEIIRRYRLFSHQPDEMITFRSLSRIAQHRGDPRLYQYGGLWMYPVGVLLKLGSLVGFVELRADQAYYLDHPEAFGRFYVVARFYTAMWGLMGVWAVFWIVRRLTSSDLAAAAGALCYTFMPVVVNMAHEAKPHLPGAVLMLLSVMAAVRYVETGRTRWWVITGALCGAALGMVLSSLVGFVVIPLMTLLRPDPWRRRVRVMLAAGAVGVGVYVLTNPYVPINAIVAPEILRSNLANSAAMYGKRGVAGLGNALWLLLEGTSPVLAVAGMIGVIWLFISRKAPRDLLVLLLIPAGLVAAQFALLAEGKPAEFARFAIVTDIALAAAAVAAFHCVSRAWLCRVMLVFLVGTTAVWGASYVLGFVADSRHNNTRLAAAEKLTGGWSDVALTAEPAPYCTPPMNLFRKRLILYGGGGPHIPAIGGSVRATDYSERLFDTPISWANKAFIFQPDIGERNR